MEKEELANKLNNLKLQYPAKIPSELLTEAASDSLLIVYGMSYDIMRLSGAIDDEVSCYNGGYAYILAGELLVSDCDAVDDCPYFKKEKSKSSSIEAIWGERGVPWRYITSIPHSEFSIWEDSEEYCRGIVFSLVEMEVTEQDNYTALKKRVLTCFGKFEGKQTREFQAYVLGIDDELHDSIVETLIMDLYLLRQQDGRVLITDAGRVLIGAYS